MKIYGVKMDRNLKATINTIGNDIRSKIIWVDMMENNLKDNCINAKDDLVLRRYFLERLGIIKCDLFSIATVIDDLQINDEQYFSEMIEDIRLIDG